MDMSVIRFIFACLQVADATLAVLLTSLQAGFELSFSAWEAGTTRTLKTAVLGCV